MTVPTPGAPRTLQLYNLGQSASDGTIQGAASDILKKYSGSLVFVSAKNGAGSGFIGQLRGTTFLFTNAHVAAGVRDAGFKTLEGTTLQLGTPAIAAGHDIFLTTLPPGKPAIEIMQGVEQNASIGDAVVVLGNAEGGGVINTILGKIVGIGPDRVEVDAPFQPGNSGSPIIHLKSGKVIGVATYLTVKKYDPATKEVLQNPVVRRFGFRLDSVKTWQPVNWPQFYAQAGEMEKVEQLTVDLEKFLIDLGRNNRVTLGAHTNPAIKSRIDQWQAVKKERTLSPKDMAQVNLNFLGFIKSACRADISAAQPRMTYDYFQRQLGSEQQIRNEMADIFDKIIKDIQKER
ncbi:MAG: serine protease [Chthoniobacter sp.]|nr:serine protease [Chthoniobacter sp.]